MLRTIIIDDEAHIRDTLQKLLARHCPRVSVIGEASGVTEGLRAIRKLNPDLVLLDIHMQDGTAFDLLHFLDSVDFRIIFVSASNKGIIQALKLSSVDYLTKPINPDELKAAVNHAEKEDQHDMILKLKALKMNVKNS